MEEDEDEAGGDGGGGGEPRPSTAACPDVKIEATTLCASTLNTAGEKHGL